MNEPLFDRDHQLQLLNLARESIQHGLEHGASLPVSHDDFDDTLLAPGAAFVTLEKRKELRGCVGSVEAHRPLVDDVAKNAWNAAFQDPRFKPLVATEFHLLHLEISILTHPSEMSFSSETDLKDQIVAHKDGLIIQDGYRRGLFLPAVWEKLPDVDSFLAHLKQKAGLPLNYWSESIRVERFYTFEFCD